MNTTPQYPPGSAPRVCYLLGSESQALPDAPQKALAEISSGGQAAALGSGAGAEGILAQLWPKGAQADLRSVLAAQGIAFL